MPLRDILIFTKDGCPFGCPCDSFDCEPEKKSVLVLNTQVASNQPVLIKYDGQWSESKQITE